MLVFESFFPSCAGTAPDLAPAARLKFNVTLMGASGEDYERVSGRGSVWEDVLANIDTLKAAGYAESGRLTLTLLLTPATRRRKNEIMTFVSERWGLVPGVAEAYPYPLAPSEERPSFSHVEARIKPIAPFRDVGEFFFRAYNNTCLHGAVDLGVDGSFRPCGWIDEVFGHWPADSLHTAMSKPQPYYYWELTKESIEGCRDCALRFACTDCTVAELDGQALLGIKGMYCPFDSEEDPDEGAVPSVAAPEGYVHVIALGDGGGDRG